jgi:cytochrome c
MSRLTLSLLIGTVLCTSGCKVSPAGRLETGVMTSAKHAIFIRNKGEKNPFPVTPENIAAGKEAFSHYCVVCHGLDGQNTGVPFAESMLPAVPSLASTSVQSYSDGQLKWVIENGIAPSGMPSSQGMLSDDEIWLTVLFIRHLPPAGSLGEPEMYGK